MNRLQIGASSESEDDPELEEVRQRYANDAQLREEGGPLEKVKAMVGVSSLFNEGGLLMEGGGILGEGYKVKAMVRGVDG